MVRRRPRPARTPRLRKRNAARATGFPRWIAWWRRRRLRQEVSNFRPTHRARRPPPPQFTRNPHSSRRCAQPPPTPRTSHRHQPQTAPRAHQRRLPRNLQRHPHRVSSTTTSRRAWPRPPRCPRPFSRCSDKLNRSDRRLRPHPRAGPRCSRRTQGRPRGRRRPEARQRSPRLRLRLRLRLRPHSPPP